MKDSIESKKIKSESHLLERAFRLLALALLSVAAFAGVMSFIEGAPIVRYAVAGVVVFFLSKELL